MRVCVGHAVQRVYVLTVWSGQPQEVFGNVTLWVRRQAPRVATHDDVRCRLYRARRGDAHRDTIPCEEVYEGGGPARTRPQGEPLVYMITELVYDWATSRGGPPFCNYTV